MRACAFVSVYVFVLICERMYGLVCACMCVCWLPRVWADHSSIALSPQQTTWGSSAPFNPTPPTPVLLQTSSSHLGSQLFSPLLLFPYNRVTKAQNTDMAARQRRELLQKNALWPNERHLHCFLKSLRRLFSWTTKLMLKTMQFEVSSVVCLLRT